MKRYKLHILLVVFLVNSLFLSQGQDIQNVLLKKITPAEGLSSYYITKIIQDKYGFLWIGTQEGLSRFDGINFFSYSTQSPEKYRLGSAFVADLAEDHSRNLIWVATTYGEICAIDEKTYVVVKRIFKTEEGESFTDKWIRSISIIEDILWIGTGNGLIAYSITLNKFLPISLNNKISMGRLNAARIFSDKYGKTWVFCDDLGVLIFDNKTLHLLKIYDRGTITFPEVKAKLSFWNYTISEDILYIACSSGLKSFSLGKGENHPINFLSGTLLDKAEILSCVFDDKKNIWFSTPDHFYSYNIEQKKLVAYFDEKKEENDWFTIVYQIFYDNSGNIWIGTQQGLASFSLNKQAFTSFSRSESPLAQIKHAYSLLPESDSIVYCGDENGLFLVNTHSKKIKQIDTAGFNLLVMKDNQGNLFVSNKKGLFTKTKNRLSPAHTKFPELAPLDYDLLNCGIAISDSIVVFGSVLQKGLSVWNKAKHSLTIYHNDSLKNSIKDLRVINNLYKTKASELFILTDNSIIYFDPVTKRTKTNVIESNTRLANIMDMCETRDSYWFAMYGNGLIQTDKNFRIKNNITTKNGLCNDAVYKVFSFLDSLIVATTNNGLAIINTKTYETKAYFQADGLHSNAFEQLCGSSFNGKIYAGGINGFDIIQPEKLWKNVVAPIVYFTNIKIQTKQGIQDTNNLAITRLKVTNQWLQTNVSFAGINYFNPERITYNYRINEIDTRWINIGKRNFINLIGLRPGSYTIEVKASNEDGYLSDSKTLTLIFLPKWYQTWWFKLLLILLVISILYSLYRIRINQLKKEHQIRSRLASDLHDDLGSTMNSVKVYANLAIMERQQEKYLFKIKESTQEAITGIRDIIWVLDDSKDSIEHLLSRISLFASSLCEANNIIYKQDIADDARDHKLGQEEKRNLYMMLKEAVNNAIKYSGGQKIEIEVSVKKGKPQIQVKDDGIGFDIEKVSEGNGLKNMNRRAKQIKYQFSIESVPGSGTTIHVQKI